jgi:hypothetical protein
LAAIEARDVAAFSYRYEARLVAIEAADAVSFGGYTVKLISPSPVANFTGRWPHVEFKGQHLPASFVGTWDDPLRAIAGTQSRPSPSVGQRKPAKSTGSV